MTKRIIEKRTSFLSALKTIFSGIPYRIVYVRSMFLYTERTKEVIKSSAKLLWTNHKDTFIIKLTDLVAYSTEGLPPKTIIKLINKESEASKKMWADVKESI